MSSMVMRIPDGSTPLHIAFDTDSDTLAALMPDGSVHIFSWTFAKGNKSSQTYLGCIPAIDGHRPRCIALASINSGRVRIDRLCDVAEGHGSILLSQTISRSGTVTADAPPVTKSISAAIALANCEGELYIQAADGRILNDAGTQIASFSTSCAEWQILSSNRAIGLSGTGDLYVNDTKIASSVTSFALTEVYLIYTTLAHELRFVAINKLGDLTSGHGAFLQALKVPAEQSDANTATKSLARRVERGSRIVTVVPSTMTVVVQLPRGNLETICPRPLVLHTVQLDLAQKRYRDAFIACRRHRIDLNVLCDCSLETFMTDVGLFAKQLPEAEYLNLFMSGLK